MHGLTNAFTTAHTKNFADVESQYFLQTSKELNILPITKFHKHLGLCLLYAKSYANEVKCNHDVREDFFLIRPNLLQSMNHS